jgi:putative acyl-CoA dehydrogenase
VLPDGTRNDFRLLRLKDKLGNRSNASAELEFRDAWARLVGEEGAGVPTIMEMVNCTRLDCVLGSTAIMRRAVAEAIHHASHRAAFNRLLVEQPAMLNVLADLSIESEAATATSLRIARAYDDGDDAFRRLATAVAKYWVCKRAPEHVAEALECIGGNGYVEESVLPRLYREAPVNSIWEGPGNIQCLDVLRALHKQPETADAFFAEVEPAAGADRRLDAALAKLRDLLADAEEAELRARGIVERLATCLQASLLVRHTPHEVADAFCATRFGGEGTRSYGTLPRGTDCAALVERSKPL